MNDESLQLDELHDLSAGLLDGSITPAAFAQLNQLMAADRQARQFFVRYVDLHATLRHILAGSKPSAAGAAPVAAMSADAMSAAERVGGARPAAASPALGFLASLIRIVPGGEFVVGGLVLLAVCGAVWGVVRYVDAQRHEKLAGQAQENKWRAESARDVGSLAVDAQARWARGTEITTDMHTRVGQRYELADGRAELLLDRGARIVIQGPAAWQVASAQRLELELGTAVAHVPESAVGFTVVTPTAEVTDLGTDFSVVVNGPQETQLAVSLGAVKLVLLEAAARPAAAPIHIVAGQALRVSRSADGNVAARQVPLDLSWRNTISRLNRPINAPSRTVALQASPAGAAGNVVESDGNIGFDFSVSRPIRIYSLGVFDHLGDGIDPASDMTVQLWSRDNQKTADPRDDKGIAVLVQVVISSQTPARLEGCHRFVDLPQPIDLPPGEYSLLTWGISQQNQGVDLVGANPPPVPRAEFDTGRYAIVPLAARAERGVPPGDFPGFYVADPTKVIGGSFEYEVRE